MNKEKQRIAIAEACGMIGPFESREEWFENGDSDGWKIVLRDATGKRVPDYLNDLNAMHEAEKVLLKIDDFCGYWETYSNVLTAKIGCMDIFHATAAQRAEALLKTLNLWENE